MGSQSADIDFALLGHQDSWTTISRIVHALRDARREPLSLDVLREIVPWIPPRALAHLTVASLHDGRERRGAYIDTFITPDDLDAHSLKRMLAKVGAGIACAEREGARIVALGGFTSIVLEGRQPSAAGGEMCPGTALTTGNTLTAALIVKGVERAASLRGIDLAHATLLIVGATGDIGSACARYLGARVRRLLLVARNRERLEREAATLRTTGASVRAVFEPQSLLADADLVICAASLPAPAIDLASCQPHAIVCDAGYPKNACMPWRIEPRAAVFWGGMAQVLGGWRSESKLLDAFYRFPLPYIAHGCMLEGMLLALEDRYEPFSQGRGRITSERIDLIWEMAHRHGFVLAPFFDERGLWSEQAPNDSRRPKVDAATAPYSGPVEWGLCR